MMVAGLEISLACSKHAMSFPRTRESILFGHGIGGWEMDSRGRGNDAVDLAGVKPNPQSGPLRRDGEWEIRFPQPPIPL
jgi:hypothetical protein